MVCLRDGVALILKSSTRMKRKGCELDESLFVSGLDGTLPTTLRPFPLATIYRARQSALYPGFTAVSLVILSQRHMPLKYGDNDGNRKGCTV